MAGRRQQVASQLLQKNVSGARRQAGLLYVAAKLSVDHAADTREVLGVDTIRFTFSAIARAVPRLAKTSGRIHAAHRVGRGARAWCAAPFFYSEVSVR